MPKLAGVFLLAAVLGCASAALAAQESPPAEKIDAAVARSIEQLGDNEYGVRDRAQQELLKAGAEAFDALSEAEKSDDIEIASQAKYLVRRIRGECLIDGDAQMGEESSRAAKDKLKEYEAGNDDERKKAIGELVKLPSDEGLGALCRLARFDESPLSSKSAAVAILTAPLPDEPGAWPRRAKTIADSLGRSTRPAANWLRAYLVAHDQPEKGLAEWQRLTDAELQTLQQQPSQSHSSLVMMLLRQQVELLDQAKRPEDALAVVRKMVQVEPGDPREPETLTDLVKWLAQRKAWPVVDEVAARFSGNFDADALLLYTLAEARLEQGQKKLADDTAEKALQLNGDKTREHFRVAVSLQERGLMDWSDSEYRRVIQIGPQASPIVLAAQFLLSDNLHDRERDGEAARVLEVLVKKMSAEPEGRAILHELQQPGRTPESVRARMNFFFSCEALAAGDRKKQIEYLDAAAQQDPGDVDVLIALYHLPAQDSERHESTMRMINQAIEDGRRKLTDEVGAKDSNDYNQLAWLVANTEGDLDEAIRCSQESISAKRAGGYLDTLGRCYYAKGESERAKGNDKSALENYENAVKYQTEAVGLEPHMQQISRQLPVYREALEKQKSHMAEAAAAKPAAIKPAATQPAAPKPKAKSAKAKTSP